MTPDQSIRDPEQIRADAARKVRAVQVSGQFTATLACLVGEKGWTTPELAALMAPPTACRSAAARASLIFAGSWAAWTTCCETSTAWPLSLNWTATNWAISSPGWPRSSGGGNRAGRPSTPPRLHCSRGCLPDGQPRESSQVAQCDPLTYIAKIVGSVGNKVQTHFSTPSGEWPA
jgi:hypothetical protein